jgi:hypothetical protein
MARGTARGNQRTGLGTVHVQEERHAFFSSVGFCRHAAESLATCRDAAGCFGWESQGRPERGFPNKNQNKWHTIGQRRHGMDIISLHLEDPYTQGPNVTPSGRGLDSEDLVFHKEGIPLYQVTHDNTNAGSKRVTCCF